MSAVQNDQLNEIRVEGAENESDPEPKSENMFENVLSDASAFMGPNYPYYKYIKDPSGIGMSSKGTLNQMGKNIDGLVEYVGLLVSGKSKASATGRPLGNKFFLETGAKCIDSATQVEQKRSIYINNVPSGNIPIVSSGAGVNFKEFRGLIPGTISNLNAFNPAGMFQAFLAGSSPECQSITMETIDVDNNRSTDTRFVTLVDIQNMDPCNFPNKTNPITGVKCKETFATIHSGSISVSVPASNSNSNSKTGSTSNETNADTYATSVGIAGILIGIALFTLMRPGGA